MRLFLAILLVFNNIAADAVDTTFTKYVNNILQDPPALTGISNNIATQSPASVFIEGTGYSGTAKESVVLGFLQLGSMSVNLDAQYGATSDGALANDASSLNVFANVLGTVNINTTGPTGSSGKSASQVCAEKVNSG